MMLMREVVWKCWYNSSLIHILTELMILFCYHLQKNMIIELDLGDRLIIKIMLIAEKERSEIPCKIYCDERRWIKILERKSLM